MESHFNLISQWFDVNILTYNDLLNYIFKNIDINFESNINLNELILIKKELTNTIVDEINQINYRNNTTDILEPNLYTLLEVIIICLSILENISIISFQVKKPPRLSVSHFLPSPTKENCHSIYYDYVSTWMDRNIQTFRDGVDYIFDHIDLDLNASPNDEDYNINIMQEENTLLHYKRILDECLTDERIETLDNIDFIIKTCKKIFSSLHRLWLIHHSMV